jgi:hypothetical protein
MGGLAVMPGFPRTALTITALVLLAFVCCRKAGDHEAAFTGEHLLTAEADQLGSTVVTPHLDVPIEQGTNVLWCGTFQLVWNEACSLIGEDLHFAGQEPEMVAALNEQLFSKADLDEASYVAVADFVGKDVFRTIRRELARKFGPVATPRLIPPKSLTPRPQDIVSYAYLFKDLRFPKPFERLAQPVSLAGTDVLCFGIEAPYKSGHADLLPQVLIFDYEDEDNFVIELKTRGEGDRLLLAKIPPQPTLQATVAHVVDRTSRATHEEATAGDILKVPKLNFDVTRRYQELEGRALVSNNPQVAKDLRVLSAVQNTRFQLDEKGVRLRSESHLSLGCAAAPRPVPRHVMIFDKPFLILMQRAGAKRPYFALWVDNAELLVSAEGQREGSRR